MPDRDSVIQAFRRCFCEDAAACPGCYKEGPGFGYECRKSLCRDVLDLLKEQEPDDPVKLPPHRGFPDGAWDWGCPKCNYQIGYGWNFCPRCGQAVNWDD